MSIKQPRCARGRKRKGSEGTRGNGKETENERKKEGSKTKRHSTKKENKEVEKKSHHLLRVYEARRHARVELSVSPYLFISRTRRPCAPLSNLEKRLSNFIKSGIRLSEPETWKGKQKEKWEWKLKRKRRRVNEVRSVSRNVAEMVAIIFT